MRPVPSCGILDSRRLFPILPSAVFLLTGCVAHQSIASLAAADEAGTVALVARAQAPDAKDKDADPEIIQVSVRELFAGPIEGKDMVRILAHVNGQPILVEEVRESCMSNPQWLEAMNMPEPDRSKQQSEICNRALQDIIDREVILSEIHARLGKSKPQYLEKIKEAAGKEFEKHVRMIESNAKKSGVAMKSRDDLKKVLKMQGLTLEGYRRQFERKFMSMEYMRARVYPLVIGGVTREHIYDYYEQHSSEFEATDNVDWQHIFIDAGKFKTRPEAGVFAAQLAAKARAGEDFAELAVKHDQGDSSYRRGAGTGHRRGEISPAELENVLFEMKDGEVGPVVESANGFHVIRLVKREHAGRKPLDDKLQGDIRRKLMNDMMARESRRVVAELRRKATIEVASDKIAKKVDTK